MPELTVRDIPERIYDRLRERAAQNRRSMSGEIVTLLEQSLLPQRIDTEALIVEAEAFHKRFPAPLPDLIAEGKRAAGSTRAMFPRTVTPRTIPLMSTFPTARQPLDCGRHRRHCQFLD